MTIADQNWKNPLVDKRKNLGIPESLRGHTILHVKSYRGVGDDLLFDSKKRITPRAWKQFNGILKREREIKKTCVVDLNKESLPDDFITTMMECLYRDQERRRKFLETGRLPTPLTGMGVWFTLMCPLDAEGMPIKRYVRSAPGPDETVEVVNKEGKKLNADIVSEAISRPAIFDTFIRAEEGVKLPYLLRAIAGFEYIEETAPDVRQRLLETLHI